MRADEFQRYLWFYACLACENDFGTRRASRSLTRLEETLRAVCQATIPEGTERTLPDQKIGFIVDRSALWCRPFGIRSVYPAIDDLFSPRHRFRRRLTDFPHRQPGVLADWLAGRLRPHDILSPSALSFLNTLLSTMPRGTEVQAPPFAGHVVAAYDAKDRGLYWLGLVPQGLVDSSQESLAEAFRGYEIASRTPIGTESPREYDASIEAAESMPSVSSAAMLLDEEDPWAGSVSQQVVELLAEYYGEHCEYTGLSRYAGRVGSLEYDTSVYTTPSFCDAHYDAEAQSATLLGRLDLPTDPEVRARANATAEAVGHAKKDWNDPLYALTEVHENGRRLAFRASDYFSWRFHWGALQDEIYQVAHSSDTARASVVLPLRDALLPDLKAVLNLNGRFCAGGVVLLLAIRIQRDEYLLLLHRRSEKVTAGRLLRAIVPCCFHQPQIDHYAEIQPMWTALREVGEELFEGERAQRAANRSMWNWYLYDIPALHFLWTHREDWDLSVSGFGLNLFTGNYEIPMLLRIHNPEFWARFGPQSVPNFEVLGLHRVHLPRERDRLLRLLSFRDWTPEGRFGAVQNLLQLQRLEPDLIGFPELRTVLRG